MATTATEKKSISLKLLIDKKKGRVIFAESEKDFIDILFSFLTLPMGTVVRLLDKHSPIENMNRLYQSVDDLHSQHFQAEACKAMLLSPRSAAETALNLKISVDDKDPMQVFVCTTCGRGCSGYWSLVPYARCPYGLSMDKGIIKDRKDYAANEDGGIVKAGALKSMITDDLQVSVVSTATMLSLYEKLGIKDGQALERKIVEVDRDKVLSLLKASMSSTNSLSEVFLAKLPIAINAAESVLINSGAVINATDMKVEAAGTQSVSHRMTMKIIKDRVDSKVLYAEIGEDLVDVLFSFLTFPLGSLINLQKDNIKLGSLNNLYKSIEILADSGAGIISKYHKSMLLAPKLAPYFDITKQILNIDAVSPPYYMLNPKLPNGGDSRGGGFVKGPARYMVTEEMVVTQFSLDSGISIINNLRVPITNLEERIVTVDESKALQLLKAFLNSTNPLTEFILSEE